VLWAALANTPHGKIPAKASGNTAWYPYGGKEYSTHDFEWLVGPPFTLKKASNQTQPTAATPSGQQFDATGAIWLAIAHSPHGDIPAKAKGNTAWYPYGGKEYKTNSFSWVEAPGFQLVHNTGFEPRNAIACGNQNDATGKVFAAIANTPHGKIPAKAKGNTAWYPYGGKEYKTEDFDWVVC